MIHYPLPPYRQKAYSELRLTRGSFPIADQLAEEVLSLPMGPHIAESDWIPVLRDTILDTLGTLALSDHERKQKQSLARISPF
jgi:dTDP-4-amino-4,6-dideoxygalactose transaminase